MITAVNDPLFNPGPYPIADCHLEVVTRVNLNSLVSEYVGSYIRSVSG